MATIGIVAATGATTKEAALVAVVIYGVLGYGLAVLTRRTIGITPWRIPAILWGLLSAGLPLFGLMIELIARFTTRLPANHPGAARAPLSTMTDALPANPAGGTDAWPAAIASRPGPNGWQPAPPGAPWTSTPPLFGWYEDPSGSHEERYWDGREWSAHVRNGGVVSNDPLPPLTSAPIASPIAGQESPGDPLGAGGV